MSGSAAIIDLMAEGDAGIEPDESVDIEISAATGSGENSRRPRIPFNTGRIQRDVEEVVSRLTETQQSVVRDVASAALRRQDLRSPLRTADLLAASLPKIPVVDPIKVPPVRRDPDVRETAENTARAATAAEEQRDAVAELLQLTALNLAASRDQREQAERTDAYTRKIGRWSVGLTAASTVAAFAALGVSVVALLAGR